MGDAVVPAGAGVPFVVLIPAYQPQQRLVGLVEELLAGGAESIVVIDDGSGPDYRAIFQAVAALPRVELLQHASNLGKGAALKTGLNHCYCRHAQAIGVVTADADGQHLARDILAVGAAMGRHPEALILGSRGFDAGVPLRSRFGNVLTRLLFRCLAGARLRDTQSGLRGIPRLLIPRMLRLPATGYAFELDMLLLCRRQKRAIVEHPIQTVYIDGNQSSHFDPLWDSLRIYCVLFRTVLAWLLMMVVDAVVFFAIVATFGAWLWLAQLASRATILVFHHLAVRSNMFHWEDKGSAAWSRLSLLGGGVVAYFLIRLLNAHEVGLAPAKIAAEVAVLLLAAILRHGVLAFCPRAGAAARLPSEREAGTFLPLPELGEAHKR